MAQLLISGCLLIVTVSLFVSSVQWSSWNRGYLGLMNGVAESCVANYAPNITNYAGPYFDGALAKKVLADYFAVNLDPYSVETTFTLSLRDAPYAAFYKTMEIDIHADLGLCEIDKTACFHIEEVSGDGQ